jgi:hypothetical protein
MLFFIFGAISLVASYLVLQMATRLHKQTMAMLENIRIEGAAADAKLAEATMLQQKADAPAPEPAEEMVTRLPNGMIGLASDFETRADGQLVRKDRWRVGFGNIVTILVGSRSEFEIDDIVSKVRVIAEAARADYETGGNGTPGSAPVWGPCPANCDEGLVRSGQECEVCNGRGEVIVEEPIPAPATAPVSLEKEEPVT